MRKAALLILVSFTLAACGSSSAQSPTATTVTTPAPLATPRAGTITVGLVSDVGGLNDRSFNQKALLGMRQAERTFHVRGRVLTSSSVGDYVLNLTRFAKLHTDLIIAVGFSMQRAVYDVAVTYPNQKFAIIDGAPTDASSNVSNLPNVANLFFKEQEGGYLVGAIAGLMEKSRVGKAIHGIIGWMGGSSIPQVDHYVAGYMAGARRVDPGISILRSYSQSFVDQQAGGSIGLQQIDQHADILFQVAGASGLGYLDVARRHGLYGMGVDTDQSYLGPFVVASAVKRVDVAVESIIRDVQTGKFTSGDHRYGLAEHGIGFTASSRVVPAAILRKVRAFAREISRGRVVPPTNVPAS